MQLFCMATKAQAEPDPDKKGFWIWQGDSGALEGTSRIGYTELCRISQVTYQPYPGAKGGSSSQGLASVENASNLVEEGGTVLTMFTTVHAIGRGKSESHKQSLASELAPIV